MTTKRLIDNFEEYFCIVTMVIMTIIVFMQVVMRYVFHNSLSWSEETAKYIFFWLSWIGASYAVKERSHFRVEMLANKFEGRARIYFEYFALIIWFLFCLFLTWYGTKLVLFLKDTGQRTPSMGLPMALPYASVPVGCGMMCIRLAIEIYKVHADGIPLQQKNA